MSDSLQPQDISVEAERLIEQYDRHVADLTRRALFAENRLDTALRILADERRQFAQERQAWADADTQKEPGLVVLDEDDLEDAASRRS